VILAGCVGDSANNPDSGTDSGADVANDTAIDAPSTWCSKSVHAFCADFDGVSKPSDGWDSTDVEGTGVLLIDNTNYTSSPNCFQSSIGAVADAGAWVNDAILARTLPVTQASPALHTEWDMRVSVGATVPAPVTLVLYQVYLNGTSLVQIGVDGVGWLLWARAGATGGTRYALSATPPSTGWVHFILDVTFASTATGSVKLQMTAGDAGAPTTLADLTNLQTTTESTAQTVSIVPGLVDPNEPTPAYQARYDDITLDVQ